LPSHAVNSTYPLAAIASLTDPFYAMRTLKSRDVKVPCSHMRNVRISLSLKKKSKTHIKCMVKRVSETYVKSDIIGVGKQKKKKGANSRIDFILRRSPSLDKFLSTFQSFCIPPLFFLDPRVKRLTALINAAKTRGSNRRRRGGGG
jgi:hypothetical protein